MAKIGIIGGGKWGEALQSALMRADNEVLITSRHQKDLPNFTSKEEVLECSYLLFALSAQHTREWLEKNFIDKGQKILVASKGIEVSSGKFLDEVFGEFVSPDRVAFISGPSFAKEVKEALPVAIVISSKNLELAKEFSTIFPSFMKVYVSDDVIGAEVSGAYKNIIAIAGGICDGLELGNNARASLIARGLVEMVRFGEFFGAKKDTFLSLAGAGDLFLSASSKLSRNYRVGYGLAKGESLEKILSDLSEVAEGVLTTKAVVEIADKKGIYVPIAKEVYKMLEGKDPKESLRDLLK
jgi:glycerol-3-phosphate dehydrogenase (NAD(P)+)